MYANKRPKRTQQSKPKKSNRKNKKNRKKNKYSFGNAILAMIVMEIVLVILVQFCFLLDCLFQLVPDFHQTLREPPGGLGPTQKIFLNIGDFGPLASLGGGHLSAQTPQGLINPHPRPQHAGPCVGVSSKSSPIANSSGNGWNAQCKCSKAARQARSGGGV